MNMKETFRKKMNKLGQEHIPFLFIIDFDIKKPEILSLDETIENNVLFDIEGFSNAKPKNFVEQKEVYLKKYPVPFETYKIAFEQVMTHIHNGNTYLLNLTFPTYIECNYSLNEIFYISKAKFKLLYKDEFVVFSPEIFVIIEENRILSFPMKGTIDASIPDAEKLIMENEKELAEHTTIVDLIRNDLSMVAKNVHVEKFRYIDLIKTNNKELLQVSSKIVGILSPDYRKRIGDIILTLLPAGSVTGAPKKKTVEIIKSVENYDRGYYTGIFGYFDGKNLKAGVMIRFIERVNGQLLYKSGGGITYMSKPELEYQELIDKIYVPIA